MLLATGAHMALLLGSFLLRSESLAYGLRPLLALTVLCLAFGMRLLVLAVCLALCLLDQTPHGFGSGSQNVIYFWKFGNKDA